MSWNQCANYACQLLSLAKSVHYKVYLLLYKKLGGGGGGRVRKKLIVVDVNRTTE
jgi:hypothetical protein